MSAQPIRPALRPHIALEVSDLAASVRFYEQFFGIGAAKLRPGYAKFDLQSPALNLTLNAVQKRTRDYQGSAFHLGVEVLDPGRVVEAKERLERSGLLKFEEENVECCYARQNKVWAEDPDGHRWEIFVVTEADVPVMSEEASACCGGTQSCGEAS